MFCDTLVCLVRKERRDGYVCLVEGRYVPEGAVPLTKPARGEEVFEAVKYIYEGEIPIESALVITDCRVAYYMDVKGAISTVVLVTRSPEEIAAKVVEYLEATGRGHLINENAAEVVFRKAGGAWAYDEYVKMLEAELRQRALAAEGPEEPIAEPEEPAEAVAEGRPAEEPTREGPAVEPGDLDLCEAICRRIRGELDRVARRVDVGRLAEVVRLVVKAYVVKPEEVEEALGKLRAYVHA